MPLNIAKATIKTATQQPAAALKAKLTEALDQWTDPQGCAKRQAFCFVYDEHAKGVVGDRRTFDAYAGHSWASGTAPFADGNNQESSSEAITAWTGLALWAKASANPNLETEAT
ncbi:MAG TPA: glycosyl hydrolase, partial [Propionibacteriaceae bacterium]